MLAAKILAAAHGPDPSLPAGLARSLWQWLALAVLLVLVFPAARSHSLWFGPAALWLLAPPCLSLLMYYRHAVTAAWRGILVPAPRRRRPVTLVLQAADGSRASVRLSTLRACDATLLDPLPGRRPVRQQCRNLSPNHDRRSLPVAGRR